MWPVSAKNQKLMLKLGQHTVCFLKLQPNTFQSVSNDFITLSYFQRKGKVRCIKGNFFRHANFRVMTTLSSPAFTLCQSNGITKTARNQAGGLSYFIDENGKVSSRHTQRVLLLLDTWTQPIRIWKLKFAWLQHVHRLHMVDVDCVNSQTFHPFAGFFYPKLSTITKLSVLGSTPSVVYNLFKQKPTSMAQLVEAAV